MKSVTDMKRAVLHGFFRSSASWRLRIALALKGVAYDQKSYKLRPGEQRSEEFLKLNPQGLVPALEIDGLVFTQSLAICEYLDETRPAPSLLGDSAADRARVRAFAQAIACEIHPLQNLKVLLHVEHLLGSDASALWARDVNREGLEACAALLPDDAGAFCYGERPTLADICLVPQMFNARRFGVDIIWPKLERIEKNCLSMTAFSETTPAMQPDAV